MKDEKSKDEIKSEKDEIKDEMMEKIKGVLFQIGTKQKKHKILTLEELEEIEAVKYDNANRLAKQLQMTCALSGVGCVVATEGEECGDISFGVSGTHGLALLVAAKLIVSIYENSDIPLEQIGKDLNQTVADMLEEDDDNE